MTQEEEEETEVTSDPEEEVRCRIIYIYIYIDIGEYAKSQEPKSKKAKTSQQTQYKLPDSLKVEIVKVLSNNTPYRTSTEESTTYGKSYTSRTG